MILFLLPIIGSAANGRIDGNLTNSPFPATLILTKIWDDSLLFSIVALVFKVIDKSEYSNRR